MLFPPQCSFQTFWRHFISSRNISTYLGPPQNITNIPESSTALPRVLGDSSVVLTEAKLAIEIRKACFSLFLKFADQIAANAIFPFPREGFKCDAILIPGSSYLPPPPRVSAIPALGLTTLALDFDSGSLTSESCCDPPHQNTNVPHACGQPWGGRAPRGLDALVPPHWPKPHACLHTQSRNSSYHEQRGSRNHGQHILNNADPCKSLREIFGLGIGVHSHSVCPKKIFIGDQSTPKE